jgi:O-Antigen Polymerase.
MLMANPLFGVGKGQFANVVNEHIISHSNYVQNMAEMGLPGLLLYVLLLYWPMKYLWLIFKVAVNSKEHAQLCAMSRVLLITLLSFVLTTAFVVMEHDILYILWALSASLILIGKNTLFPDKKLVLSSWDWLMVSLLCVACVFIIWVVSVKEII